MSIVNGPYDESVFDDEPKYKEPKALRRLRRQFTLAKQLEKFREVFGREPQGDSELEMFVETYLIEVYNSGDDEI
jgi:hypothetical protein